MTTEDTGPLFAWITEFGISGSDSLAALDALEARVQRLQTAPSLPVHDIEREYDHCLLATLGETDIVEIACFTHIYHFSEIAETAAQSSRNSTGARCPTPEELRDCHHHCGAYQLLGLPEVIRYDSTRPFIGILYLRLSTAARLCVPTVARKGGPSSAKKTMVDHFLSRFFDASAPVWRLYEGTRSASRATRYSPPVHAAGQPPKPLLIAPLIGLDGVDLIFLIRAENLDQLAAFTFATRHQRLESIWPAGITKPQPEPYVTAMVDLLHEGLTGEISDEWNSSPLFKHTRTVWGLPLTAGEERRPGAWEWHLEECADEQRIAASAAVSFTLTRADPDRFKEACTAVGLVSLMDKERQQLKVSPDQEYALTMFGQWDNLWLPPASESLHTIRLADIRSHLATFTRCEAGTKTPPDSTQLVEGLRPITEVILCIKVPSRTKFPEYRLMKRLRRFVHTFHLLDFRRVGPSWTGKWLAANSELASPYSTTGTVVNLISSFMGSLERDPESYADLLPPLYNLIEIVEHHDPPQSDLLWLVTRMKNFFTVTSRRYDTLQPPQRTVGIEGNAGYRRSADAFVALAKALASEIAHDHQVIVLERAGGELTCELGPFNYVVLWVPPFVLHYPIAWVVVSELVFAKLERTRVTDLPSSRLRDGFRRLTKHPANSSDTASEMLRQIGKAYSSTVRSSLSRLLTDLIKDSCTELVVDLALWRSLRLDNDSTIDTMKRFWFVHGPRLIAAAISTFGVAKVSLSAVQLLIVRIFLVNYIMHRASGPQELADDDASPRWLTRLSALLEKLGRSDFALEDFPDTYQIKYPDRALIHLHCLRLDLRIPDEKWFAAVRVLHRSIDNLRLEPETLLKLIDSWIDCCLQLVDQWLIDIPRRSFASSLYSRYLTSLLLEWENTSDPWPPFIPGHKVYIEEGRNCSVDRARLRGDNPDGGFLSLRGGVFVAHSSGGLEGQRRYHILTGKLIKQLEDHLRGVRLQELSVLR